MKCLLKVGFQLLLFVALSLGFYAENVSNAQTPWVTTYPSSEDFKNYATEAIPDNLLTTPPLTGTYMAGTHFGVAGASNSTHFVRTDDQGNVMVWNYLQESSSGYVDERCVAVTCNPLDYNVAFVTSLVRFDDNGVFSDRIKIYKVDYNGNVVDEKIIQSSDPFWQNIYPVSSMFFADNYEWMDEDLYICGYVMQGGGCSLPDEGPTYLSSNIARVKKAAFVMRINAATLNVLAFKTFDYTYPVTAFGAGTFPDPISLGQTPTSHPPSSAYWTYPKAVSDEIDYDIATRMAIIDNARIHVTGSITALNFRIKSTVTPSPYSKNEIVSGVMNLTLDKNTLIPIADDPFRIEDPGSGLGDLCAMGMGIFPSFDVSGYYIVANHFSPEIWVDPNYPDVGGYAPIPHCMFATYCDAIPLNPPMDKVPKPVYTTEPAEYTNAGFTLGGTVPLNSALSYGIPSVQGGEWALNILQGYGWRTPPLINDCDLWAVGYRPVPNTTWEYEPILARLELSYGATGIASLGHTGVYHSSSSGSGSGSGGPINNFFYLGYGLSNILWAPSMGSLSMGRQIIMGAPKWNSTSSNLNLKYIRAEDWSGTLVGGPLPNPTGQDYCSGSWGNFSTTMPTYNVIATHGIDQDLVRVDDSPTVMYPAWSTSLTVMNQSNVDCFNMWAYKGATGINSMDLTEETIIYPNPVNDYVSISPGYDIKGKHDVVIKLINIQGAVVNTLYQGAENRIPKKMSLGNIVNGLYFMQIYADGALVKNEKLSVER